MFRDAAFSRIGTTDSIFSNDGTYCCCCNALDELIAVAMFDMSGELEFASIICVALCRVRDFVELI
jgi:hypothetical protein